MLDRQIPDLTFPRIPNGSHGTAWDLQVLLYRGAAGVDRRKVFAMIESGELGPPLVDRVPLLVKLHEIIQDKLVQGGEGAIVTARADLKNLFRFVEWADENAAGLTLDTVRRVYINWTENLVHRYRIKKDLSHSVAYSYTTAMGRLVSLALGTQHNEPARVIIAYTRMRPPDLRKRVLSTQADKQRLDETFAFGHLMADLCDGLGVEAVRGPMPLTITRRDGESMVLKGTIKNADLDPATLRKKRERERALRYRAPLAADANVIDERPIFINLRIEAELLIFVAQTGMNLSQAAKLRREQYRWQTDGDELQAFRVYKGRRGGEAIFRCFRAYRAHLERYLAWLEALGLLNDDDRVFPFIQHTGMIPPAQILPRFTATATLCKKVGLKRFMPRALRKTRINWLLRRSRDPNLTAEMAGHFKETLLLQYEEPHHQSAAAEIIRFHQATDPTLAPPGPGVCVEANRRPEAVPDAPPEAPEPDCISPEGCLFCVHHRDVMSADYCWKLACHARLKSLEAMLHKPAKSQPAHPAHAVIDRIEAKLRAIKEGSEIRAQWVHNARDEVRAGNYHPLWHGHIVLLETLSEYS